jgi:hypothetical protein
LVILSIIGVILGASGLGVGAFSLINLQVVEGPQGSQGPSGLNGTDGLDGIDGLNGTDGQDGKDGLNGTDGQDGIDGQDAPGTITVGILDSDYGEIISGNVTIRAIIFGSENYTLSILQNGTEIGTSVPMLWNTVTSVDGCWNITIVVTDIASDNVNRDEVIVFIKNDVFTYIIIIPNIIIPENNEVIFNLASESVVHLPYSLTNGVYCLYSFVIPENYVTTGNIIFHLVWGSPGQNPTINYGITFHHATDGNPSTLFDYLQSSWTGAGQNRRNFETLTITNPPINPRDLLMAKVYMEDQDDLENAHCYGVWLEVPVVESIVN